MDLILEFIIAGVFLGGIYALMAVPMSVVWLTTDVIDVSTGAYAVTAGMIAAMLGLPLGAVVGILAAAGLGLIVGTTFVGFHALRPQKDAILIVLATFGFLIVIESALLTVAGSDSRFLPRIEGSWKLGSGVIPYQGAFNLAVSLILMASLAVLLKYTPLGLQMRACAISDRAAGLVGIAVRRTQLFTFVVGATTAGVAGVLAVMTVGLAYFSTFAFTTIAFSAAVVLGRKGPAAAFAGSMLLGVVEAISQAYLPSGWAAAVPSALIVIVLASGRMPSAAFTGLRP
ncbi:MAG: branched-chain amino acid ABC transporter permease [Candidatus Rokubacteria bacterium]|jgi:branched-chain amino acid transport system permease protein|nr:branched-chain amino acid ABC transporter permease [Candidatus Rokubacteria bacterium]